MIYTNFTRPEGARRNLLTYSEEFDNAAWTKVASTITVNTDTAPDGTITADKLVEDLGTSSHRIQRTITSPVSVAHTLSGYFKPAGRNHVTFQLLDQATGFNGATVRFNLITGAVVGSISLSGAGSGASTAISFEPSGYIRCSLTVTTNGDGSDLVGRYYLDNGTTTTYTGDGTSGVFVWGAQLETGSLTAYQPVVSGLEFNTEPLNHARIGYQNLTYGLTPTFSTAAAGFPAIAATYPTTFEYWKPTALPAAWGVDFGSAKAVDYCGIVGDLNGATIEIQSSSNFSTWTTRGTIGPTTDRINMALFLEASVRYWRLIVTNGIPNIAVVYLGKALAMQRKIYQGHTPLTLSRTTELSNNMSDGGQYLGRSVIRKGAQTSCDWSHLKADWYRANFDPFVKSARTGPFFIGWRPESYPAEMGYVWTDGDIAPTNSGPRDFMSVGVSFMGLINE